MSKIVLISCVKTKRAIRSKARDLYTSDLFKKSLRYAEALSPDKIFILSAKYGLLGLDDEIDPYEMTLNNMSSSEKMRWAGEVLRKLKAQTDLKQDHFIILAGLNYRMHLVSHLAHVEIPLKGLDFGRQLQELTRRLE